MPHATVSSAPSRTALSSPFDTNALFNLPSGKRQQRKHQNQEQDLQLNNSIVDWVENSEMGNPDQLLSPDDAITGSGRRSSSRLSFSRLSLNPFSSSSSSRSRASSVASSRTSSNGDDTSTLPSPHLSPTSSFSLSRALSRSSSPARDDARSPSYRSPLVNPSPATRRPRGPSPPPAYSKAVTAASGPTLGALPPYEAGAVGAAAPAPTLVTAPAPAPVAAPVVTNNIGRSSRRTNSSGRGGSSNSRKSLTDRKDPLAFLSQFDTIFLIDDSMSMWGSCWEEAEAALAAIAPVCTAYDKDGVDVYFLNHMSGEGDEAGSAGTGYRNVRSAAQVARLFRSVGEPEGRTTLTGMRLQRILQAYVTHYERVDKAGGGNAAASVKPINIIVVTDGEPTDEPGDVIRQFAKRLDKRAAPPYQVGIQFFQVGDDEEASRSLGRLDDDLRHSESGEDLRDMVDTVTFDGVSSGGVGGGPTLTKDGILKTVLGAVIRRLDKTDLSATNE